MKLLVIGLLGACAVMSGCRIRTEEPAALQESVTAPPVETPFKVCREREGLAQFYGSGNDVHASLSLRRQAFSVEFVKGSCRWLDRGLVLAGYSTSKYLVCSARDLLITDEPRPLDTEPTVRVRRGDVVEVELTQCINIAPSTADAAPPKSIGLTGGESRASVLTCDSMHGDARLSVHGGFATATAKLSSGSLLRFDQGTCHRQPNAATSGMGNHWECVAKDMHLTDEPRSSGAAAEIDIISGDNTYMFFNKCTRSTVEPTG